MHLRRTLIFLGFNIPRKNDSNTHTQSCASSLHGEIPSAPLVASKILGVHLSLSRYKNKPKKSDTIIPKGLKPFFKQVTDYRSACTSEGHSLADTPAHHFLPSENVECHNFHAKPSLSRSQPSILTNFDAKSTLYHYQTISSYRQLHCILSLTIQHFKYQLVCNLSQNRRPHPLISRMLNRSHKLTPISQLSTAQMHRVSVHMTRHQPQL